MRTGDFAVIVPMYKGKWEGTESKNYIGNKFLKLRKIYAGL